MIRICAAAFVLAAGLTAITSAQAAGGCGWGAHRGPFGGCRANGSGPVVVAPARAVVVGPGRPVVVAPAGGGVVYVQPGRACPYGYHLGPQGRRCWPN
jgi:hypothetical protein